MIRLKPMVSLGPVFEFLVELDYIGYVTAQTGHSRLMHIWSNTYLQL